MFPFSLLIFVICVFFSFSLGHSKCLSNLLIFSKIQFWDFLIFFYCFLIFFYFIQFCFNLYCFLPLLALYLVCSSFSSDLRFFFNGYLQLYFSCGVLVASHKFQFFEFSFSFSFMLKHFLIYPVIASLKHWLFRSVLLKFSHTCDFSKLPSLLNSDFIVLLWDNIFCMI